VIEGPLAAHGLLTIQTTEMHSHSATLPAVPVLVTRVIHAATGEQIASTYPILAKDPADPQKLAAALTYARRYSLLSVFGLTPEDDDGNTAARPASRPQTAPQRDAQPQGARSTPAHATTPARIVTTVAETTDAVLARSPQPQCDALLAEIRAQVATGLVTTGDAHRAALARWGRRLDALTSAYEIAAVRDTLAHTIRQTRTQRALAAAAGGDHDEVWSA